jgi:dihydropteroate synthase
MILRCGKQHLDLTTPKIMAVINVTPDSFYDGGLLYRDGKIHLASVMDAVAKALEQGADIIDIGGESTRPGAEKVSCDIECQRVLPVIEAIQQRFDALISVDTSNPDLIREASALGAGLINDVRALQLPGAMAAAAHAGVAVCLMHMQGAPDSMQQAPVYANPVDEVYHFLAERKQAAIAAGIAEDQILVDPGIGFGKTDAHNLALLRNLHRLSSLAPVLLGVSRKSLFGRLLDRAPEDRLAASLATGLLACVQGAKILRVHDVAATRDALQMLRLLTSDV